MPLEGCSYYQSINQSNSINHVLYQATTANNRQTLQKQEQGRAEQETKTTQTDRQKNYTIRRIVHVQGGPKMAQFMFNPLTLPNIKRFSKFFHCRNQEKIRNNIMTKDPTTPQVCR